MPAAHAARSLVVLALLAGCGAAAPESERGEGDRSAGDELRRCAGACTDGDLCRESSIDWRCECAHHADLACGGAERLPGPGTWQWTCTPIDPRTDRGDGCPFGTPAAGAACDVARTCRYADGCGWHGVDATCADGRWAVEQFMLPPPP